MHTLSTYNILNILCLYGTFSSALLVWKNRHSIRSVNEIFFFVISFFMHLICTSFPTPAILYWISMGGAFMVPLSIWILAKSLFSDYQFKRKQLFLIIVGSLMYYYPLLIWGTSSGARYPYVFMLLFTLCCIYLAFAELLKSRKYDHVTKKPKARIFFILSLCVVTLFTVAAEIALDESERVYMMLIQRGYILFLIAYFVNASFSFKHTVFLKNLPNDHTKPSNPYLLEKIDSMMNHQKLYLFEKLTIGELSKQINEHEYKVRQAINQDLGYRNFIDFINSFRIKEAVGMLQDRKLSNLTVLEIAHKTGFNSIGPFNRAFKSTTGRTPTEFRKKQMVEVD
ncbi:MAG: helix-turn-helix domain-containing protein [Bacteroidota bacterium]